MATHPRNTPLEKHSEIPVWNAEDWYWEDITPGRQIRSIRTIRKSEDRDETGSRHRLFCFFALGI